MDVLALGVFIGRALGLHLEGMRAKVVALCLQEVGGKGLGADAVVEAKRSAEGRGGDAPQCALGNNVTPASLRLGNCVVEELIEQQVLKIGVLAVGGGDVLKEDGTDDAAASPH